MRKRNPTKDKEWRNLNKSRLATHYKQSRSNRRLYAINYLGGKCVDCGETNPIVLEFDHLTPINGGRTIASNLLLQLSKLEKELDKCELVCSNCHTIRTYKRKNT